MSYTSYQYAEGLVQRSFEHWIKRQEEHLRLTNYEVFDGYYYGDGKDVLSVKLRDAFKDDPLMNVVCNYCAVVIDTVVDYISGGDPGISIDVSEYGRITDLSNYCEEFLYMVYENSGLLGTESTTLVQEMCVKGDSFLQAYMDKDANGKPIGIGAIVKRPELVYPKYMDDNYKVMEYAVNKYYTVGDDGRRYWEAQVYYPDRIDVYDLGSTEELHARISENPITQRITIGREGAASTESEMMHEFRMIDSVPNLFNSIPIFHLKNNIGTMPFGVSDLQPITPLQDLLNKTFIDLAATMDYQSFQRIVIFGATSDGEYDIGMGVVTEIPNEQGRLQVIQPGSIADFLYAIDTVVSKIATISRTPPEVFDDMSMPTSGYALEIRYLPLENKAKKKRQVLRETFKKFSRMTLRTAAYYGMLPFLENRTPEEAVAMVNNLTTHIHFPSGLPKDKVMEMQMYESKLRMEVISPDTVMEELGTENVPEEKARIARYSIARAIVNMMEELGVDDVAGELNKIAAQYGDRLSAAEEEGQ